MEEKEREQLKERLLKMVVNMKLKVEENKKLKQKKIRLYFGKNHPYFGLCLSAQGDLLCCLYADIAYRAGSARDICVISK